MTSTTISTTASTAVSTRMLLTGTNDMGSSGNAGESGSGTGGGVGGEVLAMLLFCILTHRPNERS